MGRKKQTGDVQQQAVEEQAGGLTPAAAIEAMEAPVSEPKRERVTGEELKRRLRQERRKQRLEEKGY